MISSTPYLIRGLYEWIVDNAMTPHLLVDVSEVDVCFPQNLINDNKIILNISPSAVMNFLVDNATIEFSAKFAGVEKFISFPVSSVLAIYSREDGSGMTFDKSEESSESTPHGNKPSDKGSPSFLRIVK
tara:strand:+ start:1657 stop:2043 length:387 start_codon:yes stop_codon:yes gene_type:complete